MRALSNCWKPDESFTSRLQLRRVAAVIRRRNVGRFAFFAAFMVLACVSLPAFAKDALPSSATKHVLRPRETFKECDKCPEMVVLPAGSFTMGSPATEQGRNKNEGPQHIVTIRKQFAVSKFHITVDEFAAFVSETGYAAETDCLVFDFPRGKWEPKQGNSWRRPGFFQKGNYPAVCLSWNDAQAYVNWLAHKTGKNYRLLSEAEWEYAARAQTRPGSYPRFSFGNDDKDLCRYGNGADLIWRRAFRQNWPIAPCEDGYAHTSPVGAYEANNFGLFDMQGNAWQWTEDCYRDNYTFIDTPVDGSAWTAESCPRHVIRGGSWIAIPLALRAATRQPIPTTSRYNIIGFRVGRTLAR